MNYSAEYIDELIAKYLTDELLPQEAAALSAWLKESPENRLYFDQMKHIWEQSEAGVQTLPYQPDVETALINTRKKIKQQKSWSARLFTGPRLAIAAALALALTAVWFLIQPSPGNQLTLAANTQPLLDTLTDGSSIALNQHSRLSANFSQRHRKIKLQGEAFFAVAPDPQKPFVIEVREVFVTVLGTKFNVDNLSDSNQVVVSVEEGRVKVQSGSQVVYLLAGEQAKIDCVSGQITRKNILATENIKGWFERRFVFDDVPLADVIAMLEDAYGVKISLKNPELGKCLLRTRFNNEPIERVILVIAETFSLKISNVNGQFQLDGSACGQ
jgi:ferric-dicitrate binding protein FerR (iron transport regulator)